MNFMNTVQKFIENQTENVFTMCLKMCFQLCIIEYLEIFA